MFTSASRRPGRDDCDRHLLRATRARVLSPLAYDAAMNVKRTPGWWLSQFELAVAIGVVSVITFAVSQTNQPCFGCMEMVHVGSFRVPLDVASAIVGWPWR